MCIISIMTFIKTRKKAAFGSLTLLKDRTSSTMNYTKKTGFNLYQSRHFTYITYLLLNLIFVAQLFYFALPRS